MAGRKVKVSAWLSHSSTEREDTNRIYRNHKQNGDPGRTEADRYGTGYRLVPGMGEVTVGVLYWVASEWSREWLGTVIESV